MKCPYCGYDKIQPNFNFCPKCKHSLNEEDKRIAKGGGANSTGNKEEDEIRIIENERKPEEKGFLNRAFSRWTYERAIADLHGYASWAIRNPNDNRVFLGKWNKEGHDLTAIREAIIAATRTNIGGTQVDDIDAEGNIISSTQRSTRVEANRAFVESVNTTPTVDAAAIVRNKAIWKLQPGELTRHIAPDEWVYVSEHLEGLVIEEGTSAIIYVDGQEVAQMGSGMYVFENKRAAAELIESNRRRNEHHGLFNRIADGIYRFFTGHKREESAHQREARRQRVQQIMGRLKKDTIIDVYLKSDRIFPAIFGQQHLTDSPDGYQPYVIQSRYLDILVGVSMQMQIGNFKEFIANYMAGKKTVNIVDVVKSVDSAVFSILRNHLRDIEVSERGLDVQTSSEIAAHLKRNLPNILHGIIVVDILDITTSSEQLARFRKVEEQLYCSEREYDFLIRTNAFRNRIASEENDQKIREARSEQELRFLMEEMNKDNLIHEDEMDQFVALLQNQKLIREATNKADLDKAMLEIKRNSLVSQEEFDIFENDLENRRFDREQVSEQLRARSLMATSLNKLEIDKALSIANIQNTDEISDVEWEVFRKQKGREAEGWDLDAAIYGRKFVLERQKILDAIETERTKNKFAEEEAAHTTRLAEQQLETERIKRDFEHKEKLQEHEVDEKIKNDEYIRELRAKEDELRLIKQKIELEQSTQDREAQRALENLRAMKEMELNELKENHAFELSKENIHADVDKTRIEAEQQMSADQLLGKNIANMDASAQTAFAESFSHLNEVELTKANAAEQAKLYQQMINMAQANGVNTQNMQAVNSQQQMDFMKQLLVAFTQMNANQNAGQQGLVNSMIGAMQEIANGKIKDSQNLKEEYRTQMQHEQERIDANQQQALNYTTRVKVAENAPIIAGGTSVNVNVGTRSCPVCGELITDKDALCCPNCGNDL